MGVLLLLLPAAILAGVLSAVGGDDATGAGESDDDVQKGGSGDDDLAGDGGDDLLAGFGGDDVLNGAGGRDLLVGDAGADRLSGGDGVDVLLGGTGNDIVTGGAADDLLIGGSGDDSLSGDAGDDFLIDTGGENTLSGGGGDDVLVSLTGAPGSPRDPTGELRFDAFLTGIEDRFGPQSASFDRMLERNVRSQREEPGADLMQGGDGNDTLVGDRGDTMAGGAGEDLFSAFAPPVPDDPADPAFGEVVRVEDFVPGADRIEVQYVGSGDVTIGVRDVVGGVMVSANSVDVAFVAGVNATQIRPADVLFNRLIA